MPTPTILEETKPLPPVVFSLKARRERHVGSLEFRPRTAVRRKPCSSDPLDWPKVIGRNAVRDGCLAPSFPKAWVVGIVSLRMHDPAAE